MEITDDEALFFASPAGRALTQDGISYWCACEDLWGVTFWGSIDERVTRYLIRWTELEYRREYPGYETLLDFRGTTGIDAGAFALFASWYAQTRTRQAGRVRRVLIVRPAATGLVASALAGAAAVLQPLLPVPTFDALPAAVEALRGPPRPALAAEVDALYAALTAPRSTVEAFRQLLVPPFASATLASLSARLGVSARTLQRHLQAAGSSFEAELHVARVRHAQRLLLETEMKLSAVALESGFATEAHFHTVFQRVAGEAPGRWRRQRKAG